MLVFISLRVCSVQGSPTLCPLAIMIYSELSVLLPITIISPMTGCPGTGGAALPSLAGLASCPAGDGAAVCAFACHSQRERRAPPATGRAVASRKDARRDVSRLRL